MNRAVGLVLATTMLLAAACSGDDAHPTEESKTEMTDTDLAAEAYVAGYPLVVSTRTFQRIGGLIGVNNLIWQPSLAGPQSRIIVAPNRDTLYSIAVLDLRAEPQVLTLPEVTDRYFTYQLLDAWTDSFAYIGTRATAGRAGSWAVTAPGWDGELPEGVERIDAPTPLVFLLGRFLVDDEADAANVAAISRQARLQPLSTLAGTSALPAPPPLGDPAGPPQDVPKDATFFDELADALAVDPPTTPTQRKLFARIEGLDGAALDAGAARGSERITGGAAAFGDQDDGWSISLDIGEYGDDELVLRAVVARVGWGANVPEEAVYPVARTDSEGSPLDGSRTYRIRFAADELPPVEAFWSLTAYGADMFLAEHPSGRYSIGDRTPDLTYAEDGSLEIVLSHTQPAPGPDGRPPNWLPVPAGPFVLMLRLYLPGQPVLDGDYDYPGVEPM